MLVYVSVVALVSAKYASKNYTHSITALLCISNRHLTLKMTSAEDAETTDPLSDVWCQYQLLSSILNKYDGPAYCISLASIYACT